MNESHSAVAIYDTHTEAESAIARMKAEGVDMHRLSLLGKDHRTEDHAVGYYDTGQSLKYWGRLTAFWDGVWGILTGKAFFWMPGLGPILVAGPLVASIVAVLAKPTAYGGLSAVGAALHGLGIPKDSVLTYESAIMANKFLVLVHGTDTQAAKAGVALGGTNPVELWVHGS